MPHNGRSLGASIGDYLSQTRDNGLGLGTAMASMLLLMVILVLNIYLTPTTRTIYLLSS